MSELARLHVDCGAQGSPLSSALVDAIAEARGVEPRELTTPVYHHVDPGALDGVFQSSMPGIAREGMLSFPVDDLYVTVEVAADSTAEIRVEENPNLEPEPAQPTPDSDDRAPSP